MECPFVLGEEVICVDDSLPIGVPEIHITKGQKYVIYAIEIKESTYSGKRTALLGFEEIKNGKAGFDFRRFHKVEKKKTDISVFTSMLNKTEEQNRREVKESEETEERKERVLEDV